MYIQSITRVVFSFKFVFTYLFLSYFIITQTARISPSPSVPFLHRWCPTASTTIESFACSCFVELESHSRVISVWILLFITMFKRATLFLSPRSSFFPFCCGILWHEYTTIIYPSPLDGHWACFQFWALLKKDAMNILIYAFCWACDLITLGAIFRSGIAGP